MRVIFLFSIFLLSEQFIFSQQKSFDAIDHHAKHAPLWKKFNVKKLTAYLVEPCSTDEEKARAIYTWIARHIRYDVKRYSKQKLDVQTPKKTLWRRKALCGDYASLFNAMCKEAGLVSLQVIGYSRGADFEEEDLYYNINHAWNVVRVDGKWQLIDLTYGAGYMERVHGIRDYIRYLYTFELASSRKRFKRKPDYYYFFTAPCFLISDHLPSEPAFQLLDEPLSLEDFEKRKRVPCGDTTDYISSAEGMESAILDHISSLPPTEVFIWEGDSATTFNCRSLLQQAIDYERTGTAWVDTSTVKQEEQLSVEDKEGLETSLLFFDSSKKLLPEARVLSREEAYYRSQKNKYRNQLARKGIAQSKKHQNMLMGKASGIRKKNRSKIRSLRTQNSSINDRIERINAISLDEVKVKKEPDPAEAGTHIAQNRKIIILNLDTLEQQIQVLNELFKSVDEKLLREMESRDTLMYSLALKTKKTSESCANLRYHFYDDLDWALKRSVHTRDSLMHEMEISLAIKDTLRNRVLLANDSFRVIFTRMKQISTVNSKLIKENKQWGDAETYNQLEKMKSSMQQLEVIVRKNELWRNYLEKEVPWGKRMYRTAKKTRKILNKERLYEAWRYQEKNVVINERRKGLIRTASRVNKEASRQQRLVKKLLKI